MAGLTKHLGQSTHNYRYDAYGRVLPGRGNFTEPHNHYTFLGKEWDENLGLYEFGVRLYDPWVGLWLTPEPLPGDAWRPRTWHRYTYAFANPISYYDPYGLAVTPEDGGAPLPPTPTPSMPTPSPQTSIPVLKPKGAQCTPSAPYPPQQVACPGAIATGVILSAALGPMDLLIAMSLGLAGIEAGPAGLLVAELAFLPAELALIELHMIAVQLVIKGAKKPCGEITIELLPPWGFEN